MTWRLLPGLRLAVRDEHHLQLGLDRPHVAVLPRTREVRNLVLDLAAGGPLPTLDLATGAALKGLVEAGLVEAGDQVAARSTARAATAVHLDVPADLREPAERLVAAAGLGRTERGEASVAVVWSEGEPDRSRLDGWMRSGTPHVVVAELTGGPRLGPYVVPGRSPCLRCVDAHLAGHDPRRPLVLAQAAGQPSLRSPEPDLALRALALGWVIRDLVVAADGGRPATRGCTIALGALPPEPMAYERHPDCGCGWHALDRADGARVAG